MHQVSRDWGDPLGRWSIRVCGITFVRAAYFMHLLSDTFDFHTKLGSACYPSVVAKKRVSIVQIE